MPRKADRVRADFALAHSRGPGSVFARMQRDVFGADTGVVGYTTIEQADTLARELALLPGMRLLDVGAGQGWPGLHLARVSGCDVVLTDVPASAMRSASRRAERQRLGARCAFVMASGAALPFRPSTFDAAVHTDVL